MAGAMWKAIVSLLLITLIPGGDGLIRTIYKTIKIKVAKGGDPGQQLFLTPYITAGKLEEARRLSLVASSPKWIYPSYSGYLTVNETYNSNLFFCFLPAEIRPEDAPVLLWLQGGPGVSSLFGLFVEHGPFLITKNLNLRSREFAWTKTFNILYVDNPVGAGFSFTDDPRGYATNQVEVAQDLYSAVLQFFQLFPEYQKNDFYIVGESYGGKFVTSIAHYIHIHNPSAEMKINLKGIAIGDPFLDPETIMKNFATFLFNVGLVDEEQRNFFQKKTDECINYIKEENWTEAFKVLDYLLGGEIASESPLFENITGCSSYLNILYCKDPEDTFYYGKFLAFPEVRRAIHVGNRTFSDGSDVEAHLGKDTLKTVKPWLADLMNNYKVMVYSGQLDIIVADVFTQLTLLSLDWKGAEQFKVADRKVWKINAADKDVAGYVRQVDDFYQVTVRGAGHIAPYDQPRRCFDMINRFIFDKGWEPHDA